MSKLYKVLLISLIVSTVSFTAVAQQYWSSRNTSDVAMTDKAVARLSFPKEFKVYALNIQPLRQQLMNIVDKNSRQSAIISLPNADGGVEEFQVWEASNFDPALQARFPQIRAFSGKGITDKSSTLKLSVSPQGIQTMLFRAGKENEYIEPYSLDHTVYAVFRSQRAKGQLPWVCSTPDANLAISLNEKVQNTGRENSSTGELRTMRLAQSCNGEYSNFFGAFSSADVALVLAAFNATLTRCNGCYEKDLAIHLNLIPNTDLVIFYNPATDPYTTLGAWNAQLQNTLTAIIGEANYDIGHMFGASGGGGNAGCIGCVCVNGSKGSGITSPADGIPQGDNFDIDYVAHEVGHQMGGNHTFSHNLEGTGQNKEVGSGITIMGYAGITGQDVAPHSIDIFHETTIQQIQVNMSGKTCPIVIPLAGNNATPVVAPVSGFTIPISTPFALTGSATDANAGDVLTYCWEQNDNATTSGAQSVASPTKATGPNWLSFPATTSGTRLFPRLSTILAGLNVTGPLPGGDAGANIEALSSISRTLNFRLTVRDNCAYVPGSKIGQTAFTDMAVTVTNTSGPFQVTTANAAGVTWNAGSAQNVTWDVNGTTNAPVSCANVNILFSTDGGTTFPTVLASNTPNDGSENITVPGTISSTCRIKVESVGNIFFDINNANLSIVPPPTGFSLGSPAPATSPCPAGATMAISLPTTSNGGFVNPITMSLVGTAPGTTTVSFAPNPVVPGNPVTVTLNGTNTLTNGSYVITVQGAATGAPNQSVNLTYTINAGAAPNISVQPTNQSVCAAANASFTATVAGATTLQWQESTNGGGNWTNITNGGIYSNATTNTLNLTGVTAGMNTYQYRLIAVGQCATATSSAATLTVSTGPTITGNPTDVTICATANTSFTVTATGTGLTYQWQESINGGGIYNNITNGGVYANATTATLNLNGVTAGMNTYRYRAVVTGGSCGSSTSTGAILTVVTAVAITTQPANSTVCANANTSFTAAGSGAGVIYQWQFSTDGGGSWNNVPNTGVYTGAGTGTLTITGALVSMNGYQYRIQASNATCTSPGISNAATLTVNSLPNITTNPASVTICSGSNTSFNSPATGTGITYQWQESTNGGGVWNNVANGGVYSGATSATLNITGAPIGMNNNQYRLVATGTCTPAVTSTAAILTVIAPVAITVAPATAKAVCANDNTTFTVTANSVQTIIYQWQSSPDGIAPYTNVTNTGVYSGATTATLTITGATTAINSTRYRVQVSSATCATPVISGVGILTVHALPTVGLAAAPLTSLTPGKSTTLTATPSAPTTVGPPTSTVATTWYQNGTLFNNGTSLTYLVNVEKVGGYQARVSETWTDGSVCNNQSTTVTIDATPSPKLFIYPNPTNNGQFTVSYYNTSATSTGRTVTIYGSKGERVYTAKFNVSGPYTLLNINLTPEQTGIFIVVVGDTNGKKLIEGKVVVH